MGLRCEAAGARLVGDADDESQGGVEPEVTTANGLTAKLEAVYGLTSSIRAEAKAAGPAVEVLMVAKPPSGNYGILTNKWRRAARGAVPPKQPGCSNAPSGGGSREQSATEMLIMSLV